MYRVPGELLDLLASLYEDGQAARVVAERAGLPTGFVNFNGPPKVVWFNVLKEACKQHMVAAVIEAASSDYPKLDWHSVSEAIANVASVATGTSNRDAIQWRGPTTEQLEKLTGSFPTFLPLHFFELGLARSRSVALVRLPSGMGTGCLLPSNFLLTNHHVLEKRSDADAAVAVFNHHQCADGTPSASVEFLCDTKSGFATSKEHDWTIVKLAGNPNTDWGAIPLIKARVGVGDFVNIIQHPMGGPKVIALYHNTVAYCDSDRIQYLTDTLPGSSGSPVFRSDWTLVALHHAGHTSKDPATGQVNTYNEGIAIGRIIDDLHSQGITLEGLQTAP